MQPNSQPVSDLELRRDATPPPDKLDDLRAAVARWRDREIEIADLESRLEELRGEVKTIAEQVLPDLFDAAKCNKIGIEASGNLPAFDVELIDYYHANIPTDRKDEAFAYLNNIGEGDLIKSEFKVAFGLKESGEAEQFERTLKDEGIAYSVSRGVPWNTLTAWFKSEYKKNPLPAKAMELLGAQIARIARVTKKRKR